MGVEVGEGVYKYKSIVILTLFFRNVNHSINISNPKVIKMCGIENICYAFKRLLVNS